MLILTWTFSKDKKPSKKENSQPSSEANDGEEAKIDTTIQAEGSDALLSSQVSENKGV